MRELSNSDAAQERKHDEMAAQKCRHTTFVVLDGLFEEGTAQTAGLRMSDEQCRGVRLIEHEISIGDSQMTSI